MRWLDLLAGPAGWTWRTGLRERESVLGTLLYGISGLGIDFDDRVLAHLQIVIGAKLRRSESFFLTWKDGPDVGHGRTSVWIEKSIPLFFQYSVSDRHTLNRVWLEQLTVSANLPQGLVISTEPALGSAAEEPEA